MPILFYCVCTNRLTIFLYIGAWLCYCLLFIDDMSVQTNHSKRRNALNLPSCRLSLFIFESCICVKPEFIPLVIEAGTWHQDMFCIFRAKSTLTSFCLTDFECLHLLCWSWCNLLSLSGSEPKRWSSALFWIIFCKIRVFGYPSLFLLPPENLFHYGWCAWF